MTLAAPRDWFRGQCTSLLAIAVVPYPATCTGPKGKAGAREWGRQGQG